MFFSRPIQWYHSHADPIWPDGTFNAVGSIHISTVYLAEVAGPLFSSVSRQPANSELRKGVVADYRSTVYCNHLFSN